MATRKAPVTHTPIDSEPIVVDEVEAARLLGVSLSFLRADRRKSRIFRYSKLGRIVRYNVANIKEDLRRREEGGIQKK